MFRAAIKSLCGGYYIRGRLKPSQTFLAFFQFGLGAFRGNGHKHWLQIESGTALDRILVVFNPISGGNLDPRRPRRTLAGVQ